MRLKRRGSLVSRLQKDVDEVLGLNGVKDAHGRILYDTASKLIASRRSICDSVHSQFERWDKKNCLTVEFLQDKIVKLEKMLEDLIRHFHGIKVLKNILQLRLSLIHI